jgi:hypothetical protein
MMKIRKLLTFFAIACVTFACSQCATIMNGDYVSLPVSTAPGGATVLYNGQTFSTPCTLQIPRGQQKVIRLQIEKEGYHPITVSVTRSVDGWLWGNVLLGGIVGLIVDFATGDAYDLAPEKIDAALVRQSQSANDNDDHLKLVVVDISELDAKSRSIVKARKPIQSQ